MGKYSSSLNRGVENVNTPHNLLNRSSVATHRRNRVPLGLRRHEGSSTKITEVVSQGFITSGQRKTHAVAIHHVNGSEVFILLNLYLVKKV